EAGIECTVVNGITAGLAAVTSLGVPLTHRDHAQGVIFVTGHARTGSASADDPTDWRALAATAHSARLTLVIYMGVAGAAHIQNELLHGLPGETPVAVVQQASLPQQRHIATTLARLQSGIAEAGLASPSVIVVGDVLRGLAAAALPQPKDRFGT
ncbi:MAG: uroporphyrinogen-III C-methyltransferase, partial [Variovorax sp.]